MDDVREGGCVLVHECVVSSDPWMPHHSTPSWGNLWTTEPCATVYMKHGMGGGGGWGLFILEGIQ